MNAPQHGQLLSYVGHLARLRAQLAKELLDVTPDQETEARLWGDRQRRQKLAARAS